MFLQETASHLSVKTIAARKGCTIVEAVYRYNVMPRSSDPLSAPTNIIFNYEIRLRGTGVDENDRSENVQHHFKVGDQVWVRHPSRR